MAENQRLISFEYLPSHLIFEVLISGSLSAMDLVNIQLTSKLLGLKNEGSSEFKSLPDQAASRLCSMHPVFVGLSLNHQKELLERCNKNWKRVLRFLQSMVGPCGNAATSKGKVQVVSGYNYSLINNSMIYSCGSNELGYFARGPIDLPFATQVFQGSDRNNNVAYPTHPGEVFTCGRAEFGRASIHPVEYRLKLVEARKRIPCEQVQIVTGNNYSVINNSVVHSCGSDEPGAFPHGPVDLPFSAQVVEVSARNNKVAYVTQSGEVFTCVRAGFVPVDTNDQIYKPKLVEAMKGTPCNQVEVGISFTVFLTRDGHVYIAGENTPGQLDPDDNMDRRVPEMVEGLVRPIIQISAGPYYVLGLTDNGFVCSFGDCNDTFDGRFHYKYQQQAVLNFRRNGVHIVSVSAGDHHATAIDSNGYVYIWGEFNACVVGLVPPDRNPIPKMLDLGNHLSVQVCTANMKTLVVVENGSIYRIDSQYSQPPWPRVN